MGDVTPLFGDTKQELHDKVDGADQCIVISINDGDLTLNASPDFDLAEIHLVLHKSAMAVMAASEEY